MSFEAFNLNKSNQLERVNAHGKAISEDKTQTLEQTEKLKETAASLQPQITEKEKVVSKLTTELDTLRTAVKDTRQDPKYQSKLQEQAKLNEEIESLKDNATSAVSDIESEVTVRMVC